MKKFANKIIVFLFSAAVAAALVSCSSGGNGDSSAGTTGQTGTVGILLTDKPADPSLFESINASIEKTVLIGDDDNKVVLYSGPTKTVDLLRLKNESIPFTFKDDVPVGEYCKIRLILSDLELVLADDTPADSTDNETYHPKLPGNGKLDMVARDCFYVGPGETITLQIDIDGTNSIHVVANKKGFNFRPVIFVDVIKQDFDARLVRLDGIISEIDTVQNSLLLCDAIPTEHHSSRGCVTINLVRESAFFDNVDFDGAPRPLSELLADDRIGERITVVGWPRTWVKPRDHDFDEYEYEDGYDEYEDEYDDHDLDVHIPWMAVDALAIEYGEFLQVEGNVATSADTNGFDMNVSSSGPVITTDLLAVAFQAGDAGYNGTRIVSKAGVLLEPMQVVAPLPVQVDGTLDLTGIDPVLKAALVILDEVVAGSEQVTGTVLTVATDSLNVAPDQDIVCGVATSELFVALTADLDILTVTITESGSEIVPGGVIKAGQTVGMNGRCETTGYITDNVVIVDDQRP